MWCRRWSRPTQLQVAGVTRITATAATRAAMAARTTHTCLTHAPLHRSLASSTRRTRKSVVVPGAAPAVRRSSSEEDAAPLAFFEETASSTRTEFTTPEEPADIADIFGKLSINWYPGHMHAAKIALQERVSRCHLVLEVRDARIPFSSGNPEFDPLLVGKKRVIVFNKSDLADPRSFDRVKKHFAALNQPIIFMAGDPVVEKKKKRRQTPEGQERDCNEPSSRSAHAVSHHVNRTQLRQLHQLIQSTLGPRKFSSVPPVLLVVGFPNVGKSTLINAFRAFGKIAEGANASKAANDPTKESTTRMQRGGDARVGPTPGVTRGISGFLVTSAARTQARPGSTAVQTDKLFLLDTPGIMLPYIPSTPDGVELGLKLAAINAVADLVLGEESIVRYSLWLLNRSRQFAYVHHLRPYLEEPTNDLNRLLIAVFRKKHPRVITRSALFKQFEKLTRERLAGPRYDEDGHIIREETTTEEANDDDKTTAETNTQNTTHSPDIPSESMPTPTTPIPVSIGELTSEELMLCTTWWIRAFRRGELGRLTLDHIPAAPKPTTPTIYHRHAPPS